MSCNRRANRNFRRFCITGFTNHDNIRVLPQQCTQSHCKGHSGGHIYRSLGNIWQILFHWVFNGGNIYGTLCQMLQYHIQGGSFSGTGRPGNIDDSIGCRHHFHQHVIGIFIHAKVACVINLCIRGQITQYDFFPVCGGQYGNTHADILQYHMKVTVLRNSLFCNVQIAHDLNSGNNGIVQRFFQG